MDFLSVGSINNYIKNLDMEQKWQTKKHNGDYTADGLKTMTEWLDKQRAEAAEKEEAKSNDPALKDIHNKLAMGKRLTKGEMLYLQKNDPVVYQKAKALEDEIAAYESKLKNCRTKEEVQKLRMSQVSASLATVKSTMNNPAIPKGEKLGIIMAEHSKMRAVEEETMKFIKSKEYGELPTEEEKLKAEKDMQEAEENKLADEEAVAEEIVSEDTEIPEEEQVALPDGEITEYEAENTPEAKKVRRAKFKAYITASDSAAEAMLTPAKNKIENKV